MVNHRFSVLSFLNLYYTKFWLLLLVLLITPTIKAVWIDLPSSGSKCVSEEIQRNVVVLADYSVIGNYAENSEHIPTVSVKVTSPYGNNLHHHENVTHGQFAFTTTEDGNYLACFWVAGNHQGDKSVTVGIDWKMGIAAKDWESVAKKEKIEGIELELLKLEGHVQSVHDNLIYLKNRESEMREVSERTNSRVAWFSIMSIGVCIAVSLIQVFYLKHYFQKKKLI